MLGRPLPGGKGARAIWPRSSLECGFTGLVVEANPSLCYARGLDSRGLQDQVVLAHNRWVIEWFYQDAKGELGLDDYEGRFWTGLHRHVALVMMAHSFLSIRRNHGLPPQTGSTDGPRQFPSATSVAGFPP